MSGWANPAYAMLRIRMIEEEIARRYPEGKMRCPVHLSIGQEAPAVAIGLALNKNDLMVSTHRGHAHYLAKGGSLRGLLCELYGKVDGCSRGQGGSMHLVDRSVGFMGSTSIVGGTIPIGVGLAFAKKIKGESGCVVVCIGDAAVEEGVFHEAANFASLHKLPVIFFVENNLYSCFTHISERQPIRKTFHVAQAHGLKYLRIDRDAGDFLFSATQTVASLARFEPWFLEVETYRHREHCGPSPDDHLGYRDPDEVSEWLAADPIKKITVSERQVDHIKQEIANEFLYAELAPYPEQSELGAFLYANT